ncbi:hypothetical protein MRB53_031526 [Persea americana]|uniref:Uncharacterized protein n=1 Tax=Persea americana TaxID=3435 RepID=A0ACC2KQE4_PERAE|nr:hypothetical protein MRB53_031526 [Persea americana]
MKKAFAFVILFFLVSSSIMEGVQSFDCFEHCAQKCHDIDDTNNEDCPRKCHINCDQSYVTFTAQGKA